MKGFRTLMNQRKKLGRPITNISYLFVFNKLYIGKGIFATSIFKTATTTLAVMVSIYLFKVSIGFLTPISEIVSSWPIALGLFIVILPIMYVKDYLRDATSRESLNAAIKVKTAKSSSK